MAESIQKRRPTVKESFTRPFYSMVEISPDGKKVLFNKLALELDKNSMIGELYLHETETGTTRLLFRNGAYGSWIDNETFTYVTHGSGGKPRWATLYLNKGGYGEGCSQLLKTWTYVDTIR